MAKHRFQRTRRMQATRLLLLAALVLGLGSLAELGGTATLAELPAERQDCAGRRAEDGKATPVKSAKTPAQRKGTTASSPVPRWRRGNGTRSSFLRFLAGKGGAENIMESAPGGVLPPGVRGLLISQLKLEGVVREQTANKMIAVVTNETKRAYFLT